jgi:hypothetical protein
VSPVRYELGFYIPEDAILHSHCRENLKYIVLYPLPNKHRTLNAILSICEEINAEGFNQAQESLLRVYVPELSALMSKAVFCHYSHIKRDGPVF